MFKGVIVPNTRHFSVLLNILPLLFLFLQTIVGVGYRLALHSLGTAGACKTLRKALHLLPPSTTFLKTFSKLNEWFLCVLVIFRDSTNRPILFVRYSDVHCHILFFLFFIMERKRSSWFRRIFKIAFLLFIAPGGL